MARPVADDRERICVLKSPGKFKMVLRGLSLEEVGDDFPDGLPPEVEDVDERVQGEVVVGHRSQESRQKGAGSGEGLFFVNVLKTKSAILNNYRLMRPQS